MFTHGGRNRTGIDVVEWAIKMEQFGSGEILLTSMDRDGTQSGYDIVLLQELTSRVRIPVIASGGAGQMEHFSDVFKIAHADAALAASIFHFREHSIDEAKRYMKQHGIEVRL